MTILAALLALWFGAQQLPPVPDRPAPPILMPPCPDCPGPSRPWMRGTVEIQCTMPEKLEQKRAANPSRNIVPCGMCAHKCDPLNEKAEETGGLAWDATCSARCSPKGCSCRNPCDS